jgi:hypothetical protein
MPLETQLGGPVICWAPVGRLVSLYLALIGHEELSGRVL